MQRRSFLQQGMLATAGLYLSKPALNRDGSAAIHSGELPGADRTMGSGSFPIVRIPEGQRKFKSVAVERTIEEVKKNIGNKEIAWLFENCFPNTLDTTVDFTMTDNKPDTYVITGDIDA